MHKEKLVHVHTRMLTQMMRSSSDGMLLEAPPLQGPPLRAVLTVEGAAAHRKT